MNRDDVLLAAMSCADLSPHSPVQIQKLMFLLDEELPALFQDGSRFDFQPYHYGPFDKAVYDELGRLAERSLVEVFSTRWTFYMLTSEGQAVGSSRLEQMAPEERNYVERASQFVRSCSFNQLVSAIYNAYPKYRARPLGGEELAEHQQKTEGIERALLDYREGQLPETATATVPRPSVPGQDKT